MHTILFNKGMEWKISTKPVLYPEAIAFMEQRVAEIRAGTAPECLWALEHPPLYTAGTSAKAGDLIQNGAFSHFPVYETGRGGQYTYHGPGQLVVYAMIDLAKRQTSPDIRHYVYTLEDWIINSLRQIGVAGERREGRVGIWVETANNTEKKIAAIGVRVRHGVTYHGLSVNILPDLSHFSGIVPCGLAQYGVTSIHDLGGDISVEDFISIIQQNTPDFKSKK